MARQLAPFTHRALGRDVEADSVSSPDFESTLTDLLPASQRAPGDDLTAPANGKVLDCVDADLNICRLTKVYDLLWFAGRPVPPRPLHYQRILNREIMVTERLDLHLVWGRGRIFIKPLPRYLLEPHFWEEHLSCLQHPGSNADSCSCACGNTRRRALGFLFSYLALVPHESDFNIAKDSYLLPQEIQWQSWRTIVQQVLSAKHIYFSIDPRFYYGELRLSRLNKIYFLWMTPLKSYMTRWDQYGSFLSDNFAWLTSSTVYIAIVLTAMQVGLATELQQNETFQSASYGFTVFSILGPLAAASLVIFVFFYLYVFNWIVTRRLGRKRLERIKAGR